MPPYATVRCVTTMPSSLKAAEAGQGAARHHRGMCRPMAGNSFLKGSPQHQQHATAVPSSSGAAEAGHSTAERQGSSVLCWGCVRTHLCLVDAGPLDGVRHGGSVAGGQLLHVLFQPCKQGGITDEAVPAATWAQGRDRDVAMPARSQSGFLHRCSHTDMQGRNTDAAMLAAIYHGMWGCKHRCSRTHAQGPRHC